MATGQGSLPSSHALRTGLEGRDPAGGTVNSGSAGQRSLVASASSVVRLTLPRVLTTQRLSVVKSVAHGETRGHVRSGGTSAAPLHALKAKGWVVG